MVGQDHGDAAVVQGIADPGVVDFVAFDVEAELAPEELCFVRGAEAAGVGEDVRVVLPCFDEVFSRPGVPCSSVKGQPLPA